MSLSLRDVATYLDDYLSVADVKDDARALNGLQVENSGSVSLLAVAVDACQFTIDRAIVVGADLLLVHHGLFWQGLEPLTGRHGSRVRALMLHDVALYAAHLPLDLHSDVGNNAVLARTLGLAALESFGEYNGQRIGVCGTLVTTRSVLLSSLRDALGTDPFLIAAGPNEVKRIGIITGGGGSFIGDAVAAGVDTFITGEGTHHTYFDAEESGINVIYAGHYATETVGVKALAMRLQQQFDLPWEFIDHPTGL